MAGANPITYPDIDAWARLTGCAPTGWEVSVLRRMDAASMAASAKNAPVSKDEPSAPIDINDGREVVGFMRSMMGRKKN